MSHLGTTFEFSAASEEQLATIDKRLTNVFRTALSFGALDFFVLVGHRGEAEQNAAFAAGHSEKKWPFGNHNALPSRAGDLAPRNARHKINWDDAGEFILLAGVIFAAAALEGARIRWGGDWNMNQEQTDEKFRDL